MTLKSNRNHSTAAYARGAQSIAAAKAVPRLRRASHPPEEFVAGAALVRGNGDPRLDWSALAADAGDAAAEADAKSPIPMGGVALLEAPGLLGAAVAAAALDEDEEDEDDEEDDDFDDDDDLDEDEDDLDDDEDEDEYDDDLDEDDDLDDDDLDEDEDVDEEE